MYKETPVVVFLPPEAEIELPVRKGWKVEEVRLKLQNRCSNCMTVIYKGMLALTLTRVDPETYAKESGKSIGYAKRIIPYCTSSCYRTAFRRLKSDDTD